VGVDLHELCLTQPDAFVAARNELVKQLKRDGDRDGAAQVAALRRPSWTDWALTVVAARENEAIARFEATAEAARSAQAAAVAGRSGVDLRAALRDLREAIGDVTKRAGAALAAVDHKPDLDELGSRLNQIAGDAELVRQLADGALPLGLETQPATPDQQESKDDAGSTGTRRQRLIEAVETANAEHAAITERLDAAFVEVEQAKSDVTRATAELEQAKQQLADARLRLKQAQQRHDPLAAEAATAEHAATRAQRALDKYEGN